MYLGIDFGTSFSQISTMYLEQPYLLLNPGEYGVPSEFYYDRENGVQIGQDALDCGQGNAAANLVSEVKMAIIEGKSFTLDGKTFTCTDIIKEIVRALVSKAIQVAKKRSINTRIEGAVVSVPAKFGMQERALIADAVRNCMAENSIPVKAIIDEPVAAALSYYKTAAQENRYVLVYDLGGGTCDIALLEANAGIKEQYKVVDEDMLRIGGRNWDTELIKYITEIAENKSRMRISGNVAYEEKIRRAAIAVKHELSDPLKDSATARVELNGRIFSIPVSRTVFDEITLHLLNSTLDCLEDLYEKNRRNCEINEIICVGGSSNMLQVEEGLRRRFPQCTIRLHEPEHAVVNGATIYAHMPDRNMLIDIANFSYGVKCNTNYGKPDNRVIVENIIKKGAKLPVSVTHGFRPARENQTVVPFFIFESQSLESEYDVSLKDKRLIGEVRLALPPNTPKTLELACKISLNRDGMLEVEASEPSGRKIKAEFNIAKLS